ncbi:MAG: ABC transporter ATP-binding protein [Candidatus Binatia bacterium]
MIAITVDNLGVWYPFLRRQRTTLTRWLLSRSRQQESPQIYWALRDVSFTAATGKVLGLIGRNGSGKSTLLRVLAGILQPDTGQVTVRGKVSTLMSLGAGFKADLTGRENAILNAVLLGLSRKEIEARLAEVIEFAELEEFIDMPVRTYSSGMRARLGFSVASVVQPDILLLDEVLGVGDAAFQQKSQAMMQEMLSRAQTIVVATHDMAFVRHSCHHVLWLEKGRAEAFGAPTDILPHYLNFCGASSKQASPRQQRLTESTTSLKPKRIAKQSRRMNKGPRAAQPNN